MSIRESMSQNPKIAILVAILLIVVAVGVLLGTNTTTETGNQIYFYDLGSGELFPADAAAIPPIDSPSGTGLGVVAAVYACGDCAANEKFIAYLTAMQPGTNGEMQSFIAAVPDSGDPVWLSPESKKAGELVMSPQRRCADGGDEKLVVCKP